jgi:hypothetical protein
MNITQARVSEALAVMATIDPVSQGAGTISTGWISMADLKRLLAVVQTGVLGASATVDAKLQQATSSGGAGAKDITSKAITQIVKASGDNKQALINLQPSELDVAGGFSYVRLSITVGTAASQVAAALYAVPGYEPATSYNQAAVAQVVG